jgi:hypothetical protein
MERIRPRIVEAQGQLTPEELAVQLRAASTLPTAQQPAQIQPAAQAEDDPNVPPRIL